MRIVEARQVIGLAAFRGMVVVVREVCVILWRFGGAAAY
jgi:hypothetical protein